MPGLGQPAPGSLRHVLDHSQWAVGDRLGSDGLHERPLVGPGRADHHPFGSQAAQGGGDRQTDGAGAEHDDHAGRRAGPRHDAGPRGVSCAQDLLGGVCADRQRVGEDPRPGLQAIRKPAQLGAVGVHPGAHPPGEAADVPGVDTASRDPR